MTEGMFFCSDVNIWNELRLVAWPCLPSVRTPPPQLLLSLIRFTRGLYTVRILNYTPTTLKVQS
jgi:hypothetical protein